MHDASTRTPIDPDSIWRIIDVLPNAHIFHTTLSLLYTEQISQNIYLLVRKMKAERHQLEEVCITICPGAFIWFPTFENRIFYLAGIWGHEEIEPVECLYDFQPRANDDHGYIWKTAVH